MGISGVGWGGVEWVGHAGVEWSGSWWDGMGS